MREPDQERVPADRTVVIEGPFQTGHERDDHRAQAAIKTQGRQYRVAAVIPGQADFHHFFGMTDEEREEARGWFALIELARCPARAFESGPGGHLPEVTVRIAQAPPLQRWTSEDVLNYVHEQLREYVLKREGSTWQAQPAAYPQPRPAALPQAPPQTPQPRLQPRPAASGRRNAGRDRKLSRPLKITFDREDDVPHPARTGPKKSGIQAFFDSLAEAIKHLRR